MNENEASPVAEPASRRSLLRGTAQAALSATAVALIAGCESMAQGQRGGDTANDVQILNTALGLEWEAIAAYQVGAQSGLLQPPVLAVAVAFQGDHKEHAEVLANAVRRLGGTPVQAKAVADYRFPTQDLRTQADVLRFAAGLEKAAASAYLGAVPMFGNRELAKASASILGVEAQHWALLRQALQEPPVAGPFIG